MSSTDDLRAAVARETGRRQFAEARLTRYQRQLAEARKTIKALTQQAASKPGLTEVGIIARAALLGTLDIDDEPHPSGAVAATAR